MPPPSAEDRHCLITDFEIAIRIVRTGIKKGRGNWLERAHELFFSNWDFARIVGLLRDTLFVTSEKSKMPHCESVSCWNS